MINSSELRVALPLRASGFLDSRGDLTAVTEELESTYDDDIMYGVLHPAAAFVVQALAFFLFCMGSSASCGEQWSRFEFWSR
jgi:hypothetical protein